jgi:hypothetical protein
MIIPSAPAKPLTGVGPIASIHRVAKGEEIAAAIDSAQASGATALNKQQPNEPAATDAVAQMAAMIESARCAVGIAIKVAPQ